jgi:tetratricopeptide (TPR) repeat protein
LKIHDDYERPRTPDHRNRTRTARSLLTVCAVIAVAASCRTAESKAAPSPLLPDVAAAHYRFALATPDEAETDTASIAALEARLAAQPSPFDAADLAGLYYRRAQRLGTETDYEASERLAKRSLELLPSPNPARLTLAKLANVRHQFADAIGMARRQLAGPGADARGAHLVIATAELAVGDLAHASEEADAAIALRPDESGYVTRALVRQAQGRDLEAAADFARAATSEQAGDRYGAAHLRALWGRFLLRRGAYREARAVIDEALRIAPQSPIAIAQRGELLLRTGKAADAAKTFEHAFERSRQVRYLLDEARARSLAGDAENAQELRAQIETIVRGDPRAHAIDLIEVLIDIGSPERVAEAIQLATAELTRRASFEVRFQLARALARAGRLDDAMVQLDAAVASGAREAQLFELLAHVETRRGDRKRAAEHTRLATELDPANAGWRTLGITR